MKIINPQILNSCVNARMFNGVNISFLGNCFLKNTLRFIPIQKLTEMCDSYNITILFTALPMSCDKLHW